MPKFYILASKRGVAFFGAELGLARLAPGLHIGPGGAARGRCVPARLYSLRLRHAHKKSKRLENQMRRIPPVKVDHQFHCPRILDLFSSSFLKVLINMMNQIGF